MSKSQSLGAFMDGFLRGGTFAGTAQARYWSNKKQKAAFKESERIRKVNEKIRQRKLGIPAAGAPTPTASSPAIQAAPSSPAPAAAIPNGYNELPSDRKYNGDLPSNPAPVAAPTAETKIKDVTANPLAVKPEEAAPTATPYPYEKMGETPPEQQNLDSLTSDADTETNNAPAQADAQAADPAIPEDTAKLEAESRAQDKAIDEIVDAPKARTTALEDEKVARADASMTSPNGEPELTPELMANGDPRITSHNTPTTYDPEQARKDAIALMPADATSEDWMKMDLQLKNQNRQEAMQKLGQANNLMQKLEVMDPTDPNYKGLRNTTMATLAQAVDMLPNGLSAEVNFIPPAGGKDGKFVVQTYSSNDHRIKSGTMLLNTKTTGDMLKQFTGPNGVAMWGDYTQAAHKQALEIGKLEKELSWADFKNTQDAYVSAMNSWKQTQPTGGSSGGIPGYKDPTIGMFPTEKAQSHAVDNWNNFMTKFESAYTAKNKADFTNEAKKDIFDAGLIVDDGPKYVINEDYDWFHDSAYYAQGTRYAKAMIAADPTQSPQSAMDAAVMRAKAEDDYNKELKVAAAAGEVSDAKAKEIQKKYFREVNNPDAVFGKTTIIMDYKLDGNGKAIVVDNPPIHRSWDTPLDYTPTGNQARIKSMQFGGASQMKRDDIVFVKLTTPEGNVVMQPAPKGYSKKNLKTDLEAAKQKHILDKKDAEIAALKKETGSVAAPATPAPVAMQSDTDQPTPLGSQDAEAEAGIPPVGLRGPGYGDRPTTNKRIPVWKRGDGSQPASGLARFFMGDFARGGPNAGATEQERYDYFRNQHAPENYGVGIPGEQSDAQAAENNRVGGYDIDEASAAAPLETGTLATPMGSDVTFEDIPAEPTDPEFMQINPHQLQAVRQRVLRAAATDLIKGKMTPQIAEQYKMLIAGAGKRGMDEFTAKETAKMLDRLSDFNTGGPQQQLSGIPTVQQQV